MSYVNAYTHAHAHTYIRTCTCAHACTITHAQSNHAQKRNQCRSFLKASGARRFRCRAPPVVPRIRPSETHSLHMTHFPLFSGPAISCAQIPAVCKALASAQKTPQNAAQCCTTPHNAAQRRKTLILDNWRIDACADYSKTLESVFSRGSAAFSACLHALSEQPQICAPHIPKKNWGVRRALSPSFSFFPTFSLSHTLTHPSACRAPHTHARTQRRRRCIHDMVGTGLGW